MRLNELTNAAGAKKPRKRVGRGIGSGLGKTAGRGHKGQKSRSGVALKGFEGGQTAIYRRLPKRGFRLHAPKRFAELSLGRIQELIDAKKLDAGKLIDEAALVEAGAVRRAKQGIRLLANGELKSKVQLKVAHASAAAVAAIEKAGGSVEMTHVPNRERKGKGKAGGEA
ncbi:MAG TPA: 50S ribosomal protein L15 [Thermopetrobacter sp.]|nr:50S ribosomal protein L15 [Thermopetrobacter sp.]